MKEHTYKNKLDISSPFMHKCASFHTSYVELEFTIIINKQGKKLKQKQGPVGQLNLATEANSEPLHSNAYYLIYL